MTDDKKINELSVLQDAIERETALRLSPAAMSRIMLAVLRQPDEATADALEFLSLRVRQGRMTSALAPVTAAGHVNKRANDRLMERFENCIKLITYITLCNRITNSALDAYVSEWVDAEGTPVDPPTMAEWNGLRDQFASLVNRLRNLETEWAATIEELRNGARNPDSDSERARMNTVIEATPNISHYGSFILGWKAALSFLPTHDAAAVWSSHDLENLTTAIEGECNGLAISSDQAANILNFIRRNDRASGTEPKVIPVIDDTELLDDTRPNVISPCRITFAHGKTVCKSCRETWDVGTEGPPCPKAALS